MQYWLILILLVCCGVLTNCINLCDTEDTPNLTNYSDTEIQNCGCKHECIRKCCKAGYFYGRKQSCYKLNKNQTHHEFPVYRKRTEFSKNISTTDNFIIGILECRLFKLNNSNPNDNYFIQENGLLWMPAMGHGIFYENTNYCIDELDGFSVFMCYPGQDKDLERNFNNVGMIISMPFLLTTFLVYAILPDRNVHQRALMFYVLTLCIAYILLVTINFMSYVPQAFCEIIGYTTLFFFMVSLFWMNVICFDIWYTFSGGRGFIGSKRTSENRRFLIYNIYAWGVPIIHIGIVKMMTYILPETSVHHPQIGIGLCFLAEGWPNLWYLYGEAAILIITNIVFFLRTAFKIRQVKRETSMLKHSDSKRHAYEKDKQKFNLYLKLLFAMGVNWSMEVISWLVGWQTNNKYNEIWYVTDFFNAMYGVFIFFIFVFKKKIWKLLQKRYYNFIGKPHLAHAMTSTETRTSHYSSTNHSTTETGMTDRTNGTRPEEIGLRRVT